MGRRISVIGGDMRQYALAEYLIKDGFDVSIYGFDPIYCDSINPEDSLSDTLNGSRTIVLGINPCDGKMNISTPLWQDTISVQTLINHISPESTIIGGKISSQFFSLCKEKSITCIDYVSREDFAVLNAVPTAEGAIEIAMQELPVTLHRCNCLITGFGRIGKILARDLFFLGADVTCSARKSSDIAWINSLGYKAVYTKNLSEYVHNCTVIFNTIPHLVFDREILRNLNPNALIIDLASKPGGVDFKSAENLGIKVIHALSLPGKVAPATAGKIIKDTLLNILNEM